MKSKWLYLAACFLTSICGFAQELATTPCKTPTETSFDLKSFKTTTVKNPKLDSSLVALANAFAETSDSGLQFAATRGMLTDQGNDVLVEIRVNQQESRGMRQALDTMGMRVSHHNVAGLFEAWVPIDKLAEMAKTDDVYFIRPARRVDLAVGSSNQNDPFRRTQHRGDYLSRHRIDGRMDPVSCRRCHGNPKSTVSCKPCHG